MAIKDYKARASASQLPKKKGTKSESASKKTITAFGVGFLSGALVTSAVCIIYLDNNHPPATVEQTRPTPPDVTDNKEQPETPTPSASSETQPENQSIDYQFYEALEKFELPEPVQDTSAQNETDNPITQNARDKDSSSDKASAKKGEQKNKTPSPTRYILQAGTFTNSEQAQAQRRKIVDLGYKDAHIFQTAYDNKQYYRVWLGPYRELEQAKTIGNTLKAAHIEVMLRHDLRSFDPKE